MGGTFNFAFTDAEIAAQVTSAKGIDSQLYPDSSNRTFNVEATFGGIERDASGAVTAGRAELVLAIRFVYVCVPVEV